MRVSSGVIAALALGLGMAGGSGAARAQQAPPPAAPQAAHPVGEYGGVEPGAGGEQPAQHPCRPRGSRAPLTWIGFQPRAGGAARVFVQLCGEVEYEQDVVDGKLVVSLFGARLASSNARRPLDTRFFNTAVARVQSRRLRRRGKHRHRRGVQLVIRFKDPAGAREATASMKTEPDGYTYLFLDFGA